MMKIVRTMCAVLAATVLSASPAQAQPFPNRPIRVLVTIPPGGAPDISARMLAQSLNETLGWSVVIENRPGANGNIAAERSRSRRPTATRCCCMPTAASPSIRMSTPSCRSTRSRICCRSRASPPTSSCCRSIRQVPAKTFQEFIDYARKTTPPLPYASGGNGSQHQLMMEMLKQRAKIDLLHVPFRGAAPATTGDGRGRHQGAVLGLGERVADPGRAVARGRHQRQEARRRASPTCRPSASSTRATRSTSGSACSRRPERRSRS